MTISQDPSAPLVVVCGATGIQGGSVINRLAESDRAYRFRGLTRDTTKATAQELASRGVEIVGVTLSVGNEADVKKAFEGASIVFAVTNFWEHGSKQREIDEGKLLVDSAKAVGADLFVWSGLNSVTEDSGGKAKMDHFDSKAEVTAYAKKSGIPLVVVQAGFYSSNLKSIFLKPEKQADGSYTVKVPFNPEQTILPIIDMDDYGLFVREAIESPAFGPGTEVLSCGELLSLTDAVAQLAKITGKVINCVATIDSKMPTPENATKESVQSNRFKYYGSKDVTPSLQHLARKPRTWAEYAKATNWDEIFE